MPLSMQKNEWTRMVGALKGCSCLVLYNLRYLLAGLGIAEAHGVVVISVGCFKLSTEYKD